MAGSGWTPAGSLQVIQRFADDLAAGSGFDEAFNNLPGAALDFFDPLGLRGKGTGFAVVRTSSSTYDPCAPLCP
jgi:hypothetical protein